MDLQGWDERYRREPDEAEPTPLLQKFVRGMRPGRALDLAAGAGRNALWLARQGWDVMAVDGAPAAIRILEHRAAAQGLAVTTLVTDLVSGDYTPTVESFDLIVIAYYLQRNLMERAKMAVRPGGVMLTVVHITEGSEEPSEHRLLSGELRRYFAGWEITHDFEGKPSDPAHKRAVAEIGARRRTVG